MNPHKLHSTNKTYGRTVFPGWCDRVVTATVRDPIIGDSIRLSDEQSRSSVRIVCFCVTRNHSLRSLWSGSIVIGSTAVCIQISSAYSEIFPTDIASCRSIIKASRGDSIFSICNCPKQIAVVDKSVCSSCLSIGPTSMIGPVWFDVFTWIEGLRPPYPQAWAVRQAVGWGSSRLVVVAKKKR